MKEFSRLCDVMEALLAPTGCPWDRNQTFESMRHYLLEEAHEVIEAINLKDYDHLCEEIGDLFINCVFLCKLGEKGRHFTIEQTLNGVVEKLIRRHPHVFGDVVCHTEEDVRQQWRAIKAQEKQGKPSSPVTDDKTLPALARIQKRLKADPDLQPPPPSDPESELAAQLWQVVRQAHKAGLNAEQALVRSLQELSHQSS
ncbi:MAG: hypothetical protein JSR80_08485 [Verrucomicrobia bacterium]|nr:hypothetical protein [Verrucomicrobiota bacterium]